jgi:hypothetical protein
MEPRLGVPTQALKMINFLMTRVDTPGPLLHIHITRHRYVLQLLLCCHEFIGLYIIDGHFTAQNVFAEYLRHCTSQKLTQLLLLGLFRRRSSIDNIQRVRLFLEGERGIPPGVDVHAVAQCLLQWLYGLPGETEYLFWYQLMTVRRIRHD